MQEFVSGINVSSSILSTGTNAKTIISSRLLTENDFEKNIRIYDELRRACPYPYSQEYDARWRVEIELSQFIQELNK